MPTYVYACSACGHSFEARQKFSEDPLTTCPECSGAVRRVIQPPYAVHYGWNAPSILTSQSDRNPRYAKHDVPEMPEW